MLVFHYFRGVCVCIMSLFSVLSFLLFVIPYYYFSICTSFCLLFLLMCLFDDVLIFFFWFLCNLNFYLMSLSVYLLFVCLSIFSYYSAICILSFVFSFLLCLVCIIFFARSPRWRPTRLTVARRVSRIPSNNQLIQALKPYPQFTGIPPFLGPPWATLV